MYIESLRILSQFPIENIWMLAVDGKFYEKEGPLGFENREKGSVQAVLNALLESLQKLGEPLSVADIQRIHTRCMTDVPSRNPCTPGQFRTNNVAFEVLSNWCTPKGLEDLLRNKPNTAQLIPSELAFVNDGYVPLSSVKDKANLKLAFDPDKALAKNCSESDLQSLHAKLAQGDARLVYQPPEASKLEQQLAIILRIYNSNINQANTDDEKILLIAELIQRCTRLHPFRDGNNRTFVNCLANRLLIENGLCPVLLFEPNIFEFHTPTELVSVLKDAQQQFMSRIQAPETPIFNYDNSKIGLIEDGKFVSMGRDFKQRFSALIYKLAQQQYSKKNYLLASEYFQINYELEKQINDKSTNSGISLFSLALSLKQLGQLQLARTHFSNTVGLFNSLHKQKALINKAEKHIKEIDVMLSSLEEKNTETAQAN
ncbi:ankyrin repeat-containing protein [Legionella nautarum]|uniref:Ankyrin repeat-containing protein n=1 Tax=Legionella nautarum TaxID=45070 RepID=A0A0W0WNN3_9GAMM|nr:Fic family protein [Legionella nautarum]KTD33718.1 ankyrin repeat-containing protein [Legionella nautarum]